MRIATRAGRTVLVSPDGTRYMDVAEASGARFGPDARTVYDRWDEFTVWARAADLDFGNEGNILELADLGAPSDDPRQVFAIGLNYRDHADESGLAYPDSPPTFTKFLSSFAGPVGELELPAETVDFEAELVVVMGRTAVRVSAADAWSYVAGLTAGQDYSERALQLTGPAPQFSFGKSYRGFAPQGPWLVTLDDVDDPDSLAIECRINGEVMQKSTTDRMIFSVPTLIERLSAVVTLMPGDVIFTGTPAGVGGTRQPPRFLRPGDVVETAIKGIGEIRQVCVER